MSETVDSLTVYRDNKRVCPLPKAWQQLWEMLPEKRRAVDAWEPAIPLIGAAWHDAPAMLKMVRLTEHLQWAAKHNALSEVAAFLRVCGRMSGTTRTLEHCQLPLRTTLVKAQNIQIAVVAFDLEIAIV
jgi:hypothetical protein